MQVVKLQIKPSIEPAEIITGLNELFELSPSPLDLAFSTENPSPNLTAPCLCPIYSIPIGSGSAFASIAGSEDLLLVLIQEIPPVRKYLLIIQE